MGYFGIGVAGVVGVQGREGSGAPPPKPGTRSEADLQAITQQARTDSGLTDFTPIDDTMGTTEFTTPNEKVVADMEFAERFLEDLGHTDIGCTNAEGTVTVTGSVTGIPISDTEYKLEADDLNVPFNNCAGIMEDQNGTAWPMTIPRRTEPSTSLPSFSISIIGSRCVSVW